MPPRGPRQEISVKGVERTTARLAVLGRKAADPTPAWETIEHDFHNVEAELFATRGASGGKVWPKVSDATKARWPNHSGQPLVLTGALRDSLTHRTSDSLYKPTKLQLRVGTKLYYARFQARRPPIQVTRADNARWRQIIQAHLLSEIFNR